jgi:heat shock protein HslJ
MKATFAALALTLVSGCTTVTAPPVDLTGSSWSIVSIDGTAAASPKAAVTFNPDRLSATAGCNGLGGSWEAKDGQLITGPFVSTMMFCDGLMEQERALSQTFGAKPLYVVSGDKLTLTGGGHTVELRRSN